MRIIFPPQISNYIKAGSGELLYPYIISIGVWDMDADEDHNVAHGLGSNWSKIQSIHVWVRNFANTQHHHFDQSMYNVSPDAMPQAWVWGWDDTNIYLQRRAGGFFDSVSYGAGAFSRGNIMIWFNV